HSYTFTAIGSTGTPLSDLAMDLRDANGNILVSVVDGGVNGAASLSRTATATGTDYLAISAGGSNPASLTGNYQITAIDNGVPSTDTVLDTTGTNAGLTINGTVTGTIDPTPMVGSANLSFDHACFTVAVTQRHSYTFTAI